MELTHLRHFIAIAREGHMTRAAKQLGLTQPALSASIRKLETELGVQLLLRSGRGLELSSLGKAFLIHAQATVLAAESAVVAVREMSGLNAGSIRLGGGATATTFLLPPVVFKVRKNHPGLRFYVREGSSSAIADAVLRGELDLGIVTLPVLHPQADLLDKRALATDELRLIVPPKHPLRSAPHFRWKDLAGEPIVAFEAGSAVREMIDRAALEAGVKLDVVMELRSIESIRQMVSAGIGVGFVSRFALPRAEAGGLPCKDGRLTRQLAIVTLKKARETLAVGTFKQELLKSMNELVK